MVGSKANLKGQHCCSPSPQELAADVLSETEVFFLFKPSMFLEEWQQFQGKIGKTIFLSGFYGELLPQAIPGSDSLRNIYFW